MYVSKHAVQRFLQRGRLLLYPEEIVNPIGTIKRFVEKGYKNIRLESCPFYKNKLGASVVEYQKFKFYIRDGTVLTCVVMSNDFNKDWRY